MPKNAVQKLQEIQNDINTVISLYEVANKTNNNDKPQTSKKQNSQQLPQISASKHLEAIPRFDKFREVPGKPQTSFFDSFKKASSFFSRPSQGLNPREPLVGKKRTLNKPGSAPSSTSTIFPAVESDYVRQQASDAGTSSDRGTLAKAKTSENLSSSEWLRNSDFPDFDVVMTPSKTLETAKEILEKNNFKENEESGKSQQVLQYEKKTPGKSVGDETANSTWEGQKSPSKITEVKSWKKEEKSLPVRSRSASPRDEISVSHFIECSLPATSKSVVTAEVHKTKGKSLFDICPKLFVYTKECQKTDRETGTSGIPKNAKSTTSKYMYFKAINGHPHTENDQSDKNAHKTDESKAIQPQKSTSILKHFEKSEVGDKLECKSRGKIVQFLQVDEGVEANQKTEKPAKQNDAAEEWANEVSKIIQKSNEKLEKMKGSKELALDIANHFKEKYDEMEKSKGELWEKLQTAEKTNERLNSEVQEARESSKKLHEKLKGLEENSSVEETQDNQLKDLTNEIQCLKAKLCETEQHFSAQLLEKNKTIEEIQMSRLEESRSGLKNQEMFAKKLQRLTKEKSELLSKFEDLRRELHHSQFTTKTLEENIRQLEEEVQKQKQHLKIKTETLHETNRELEMIRVNCTDLEDQVKMLRKNMEEFDGIQHSLIRKTTEYEQQIKSSQEKIKELQDENFRLKDELENEKDGLRIKEKIIEDQQHTIRQLKEKSEDAKTLLKRNQSLERVLNIEREEKLELQEAVQRLKWRKEELKKKVKTLENDFLLAPQEVVRDLQKTQLVLHELENQVQVKQKEWELQLHSLIREKEQACSVAEFATRKLMETTSEFQKQSEAYKGLQRLVAGNLAAKERHHLREGSRKVSTACYPPEKKPEKF